MRAPAKINLDLLITGRRDGGYHLLDSVVVFTELGDELTVEQSDHLSLSISGPFANELEPDGDNLILKAARLICEARNVSPNLKFHLIKNLPVSSGIGGGSTDAAVALKLTMNELKLNVTPKQLKDIALKLGADVPACLLSSAAHMTGIGERLVAIKIEKPLYLLLVNPGVSVSTPDIFKQYESMGIFFDRPREYKIINIHDRFIDEKLMKSQNSLEKAASILEPEILKVLKALENIDGLIMKRMSGSGATCFGVFDNKENCLKAKKKLKRQNSSWWIEATKTI